MVTLRLYGKQKIFVDHTTKLTHMRLNARANSDTTDTKNEAIELARVPIRDGTSLSLGSKARVFYFDHSIEAQSSPRHGPKMSRLGQAFSRLASL